MAQHVDREWTMADGKALVHLLYGDAYECTGIRLEKDVLHLEVESADRKAKCVCCGEKSAQLHSTYHREFQELPVLGTTLMTDYRVRTYYCMNKECGVSTFAEELPFVGRNQKRSVKLDNVILVAATLTSHETASEILHKIGVRVSPDAIDRLLKKVQIENNPDVRIVGIDDIAYEKGHVYLTVLFDGETGEFLRLLKGRDQDAVDEWLKEHPGVEIVARDRASAYAAAVSKDLPNAEQIADRFHLMKNLVDYLSKYLRNVLPDEIWVDNDRVYEESEEKAADDDDSEDPNQKWIRTTDIIAAKQTGLTYDNSPPVEAGRPVSVDSQLHADSRKSDQKQAEKVRLIREMQSEQLHNPQPLEIVAKKWNVCLATAKKYLGMTVNEIDAVGKSAARKPWGNGLKIANVIYKMMKDNLKDDLIFSWIRAHDFDVPDSAIIRTMKAVQTNHFPDRKKVDADALRELASEKRPTPTARKISRKELEISILTLDPKKEAKDPLAPALPSILAKMPDAAFARKALERFHTLLTEHHPDDLQPFINDYSVGPLESFSNGIKRDFQAVQNAAASSISSGFVEGSNNKIKLIKRTAYGRDGIPTLERRIWLAFQMSKKKRDPIEFVHYPKRKLSSQAA